MKKDEYGFSRICYIGEATFEYFISLMITGAFLAKLTSHLGFSDSLTAILSSFVALGCSFQMFSIAFFRAGQAKRRVTFLHILNQLLFMAIYLVPFFRLGKLAKTVAFIIFLLGGYFISNVIFAPKTNWFMSLVPDKKRGIFTSVKEMVSLVGGFLFNFGMGTIIDRYESEGNVRGAFVLCAIAIFVLMLLHTCTLVFSKEKPAEESVQAVGIRERFGNIIADRDIIKVISISIFWTISYHFSVSFFGTYQIKELGFSMQFVALLSLLYAVVRVPCSFLLGHYADKHSFAKMLKICYGLAAVSFLFATFTVPGNGKVFYTVYYLIMAAAMGGINSAEINLIFDYVDAKSRSDALAVKQTVYGLCGFLATVAVTPFVDYIQNAGNQFFGMHVYAQQILSAVSFVCTLLLILYLDKIILRISTKKD
ncbi:MAG: MFS transporter [Ruminococcaceae bacterium]|nr:MFS transporter [Oscillospiraceae bacterium]